MTTTIVLQIGNNINKYNKYKRKFIIFIFRILLKYKKIFKNNVETPKSILEIKNENFYDSYYGDTNFQISSQSSNEMVIFIFKQFKILYEEIGKTINYRYGHRISDDHLKKMLIYRRELNRLKFFYKRKREIKTISIAKPNNELMSFDDWRRYISNEVVK